MSQALSSAAMTFTAAASSRPTAWIMTLAPARAGSRMTSMTFLAFAVRSLQTSRMSQSNWLAACTSRADPLPCRPTRQVISIVASTTASSKNGEFQTGSRTPSCTANWGGAPNARLRLCFGEWLYIMIMTLSCNDTPHGIQDCASHRVDRSGEEEVLREVVRGARSDAVASGAAVDSRLSGAARRQLCDPPQSRDGHPDTKTQSVVSEPLTADRLELH
ncbi:conserved hypothetical protein [Ricinus communis]|uniref:Uncharacterized protein n=1 Tax=Ricinus communis TaxID=3988 RepID=B9TAH7_RICCO|nr:conserved hypothetical protein [Ricinus communis]